MRCQAAYLCRAGLYMQEMKAIMQQGVQELPYFDAFMLKGKLGEYEQKVGSRAAL